jgi:hypothetical protein
MGNNSTCQARPRTHLHSSWDDKGNVSGMHSTSLRAEVLHAVASRSLATAVLHTPRGWHI